MGLWECGQSKPGPRHGRKRRKGLSTFPRPDTKKIIYEKAPQGCCGMESAEPGPAADSGECGKRGQSGPRTRNPNAARIRIVHRFPCSPRRRERKTAERPEKTEIRDAVRVHHRKRTNRTRRSPEDVKPARTLDDPLPPRFHPDFDNRETQLLGQAAAALQALRNTQPWRHGSRVPIVINQES